MHMHRSSIKCNKQNAVEEDSAHDGNKRTALHMVHTMMFYNVNP